MEVKNSQVEMPGIEPGASYMQSMRSTTELHPLIYSVLNIKDQLKMSCGFGGEKCLLGVGFEPTQSYDYESLNLTP